MFSKSLSELSRSFSVRLSLWYALMFTLSAGIVFGLLYFLLAAALERKDHSGYAPLRTRPEALPHYRNSWDAVEKRIRPRHFL